MLIPLQPLTGVTGATALGSASGNPYRGAATPRIAAVSISSVGQTGAVTLTLSLAGSTIAVLYLPDSSTTGQSRYVDLGPGIPFVGLLTATSSAALSSDNCVKVVPLIEMDPDNTQPTGNGVQWCVSSSFSSAGRLLFKRPVPDGQIATASTATTFSAGLGGQLVVYGAHAVARSSNSVIPTLAAALDPADTTSAVAVACLTSGGSQQNTVLWPTGLVLPDGAALVALHGDASGTLSTAFLTVWGGYVPNGQVAGRN